VNIGTLSGPELEYFVLARLERMARRLADPSVEAIPAWHALMQHAVSVAYRDCAALGLDDEAAVIVADVRGEIVEPA
jgi:hypothetical protein